MHQQRDVVYPFCTNSYFCHGNRSMTHFRFSCKKWAKDQLQASRV